MEVDFESRQLRRCYEESAGAVRRWGPEVGRRYIARIQALYAANKFEDLETLNALGLHELKGAQKGQYAVTLNRRWRLLITPKGQDGVRVQEVVNHYGD